MSTVQPTDKVLVQRAATLHSAPADMSTVQDTDLLLINRAGVDYKCSVADWKASQSKPPAITSVTLADSPEAGRFTSGTFRSTVVADDGTPAATKGIKAWVQGSLKSQLTSTNAITAVAQQAGSVPTSFGASSGGFSAPAGPMYYACHGDVWVSLTGAVNPDTLNYNISPTDYSAPRLHPAGLTNERGYQVNYEEGIFAAYRFTSIYSSTDGKTWVKAATAPTGGDAIRGGCRAFGRWYISYGTTVQYSTPGSGTWTHALGLPATESYHEMAANTKGVVVLAQSGRAFCSADGITFTEITADIPRTWVRNVNDRLFSAGSWSDDAVHWFPYLGSASSTGVSNVIYDESTHVYISVTSRHLYTSADGTHWLDQGMLPSGGLSVSFLSKNGFLCLMAKSTPDDSEWIARSAFVPAKTILTIAGCQSDGFAVRDTVSNAASAAAATGGITSVTNTTVEISPPDTDWAIGQKLHGEPKTVANTKLYCKLNPALHVTDLQSADPGYTAVTGAGPYTVTFPATLPTGAAPDVDLPAGTSLTTEVQAVNASATVTKTSNTVVPT